MGKHLQLAGIIEESVVDGPGVRFVLFGQGCRHHCPGCHNPQSQSFVGGQSFTIAQLVDNIRSNPLIQGVTFSGGDPFEQADGFATLGRELRKLNLSIVTYTGYRWQEIIAQGKVDEGFRNLIEVTDVLIDGRFEVGKKDLSLPYRGSTNQRVIDVPKTILSGRIIEIDYRAMAG